MNGRCLKHVTLRRMFNAIQSECDLTFVRPRGINNGRLGYEVLYFGGLLPTFRWNILPPSSCLKCSYSAYGGQNVLPKRRKLATTLLSVCVENYSLIAAHETCRSYCVYCDTCSVVIA